MLEVTHHGYVGRAPELRYVPSGDAVATFLVASTERWTERDSGEIKEKTTWVRWDVWGKQAENLARLVRKGSQILIRGTIRNSSYEKDGETLYQDHYVVDWWKLLDRKPRDESAPGGEEPPAESSGGGMRDLGNEASASTGNEKSRGNKARKPAAPSGAPKDDQPF